MTTEPARPFKARNMDRPHEEPVSFVATDYARAKAIARSMWPDAMEIAVYANAGEE